MQPYRISKPFYYKIIGFAFLQGVIHSQILYIINDIEAFYEGSYLVLATIYHTWKTKWDIYLHQSFIILIDFCT